jgi:hypothetical protein
MDKVILTVILIIIIEAMVVLSTKRRSTQYKLLSLMFIYDIIVSILMATVLKVF